jgi:hypothetical protein
MTLSAVTAVALDCSDANTLMGMINVLSMHSQTPLAFGSKSPMRTSIGGENPEGLACTSSSRNISASYLWSPLPFTTHCSHLSSVHPTPHSGPPLSPSPH